MNQARNKRIVIFILVILFAVLLFAFAKYSSRFSPSENLAFAKEGEFLKSNVNPDFSLSLVPTGNDGENNYCVAVFSRADNSEIFRTQEQFRIRDTLLVTWDDDLLRFWVYSGDVGTFYWDLDDDSKIWTMYRYADHKDAQVPIALKEARPRYFQ